MVIMVYLKRGTLEEIINELRLLGYLNIYKVLPLVSESKTELSPTYPNRDQQSSKQYRNGGECA